MTNQEIRPRLLAVTTLLLDNNAFRTLDSLSFISDALPKLETLSVQGNLLDRIAEFEYSSLDSIKFPTLETINLSRNQIADYAHIDELPYLFPNLTSLQISNNPIYHASSTKDRLLASQGPDTTFYLILARIPNLQTLNYTTINPRDREEGEIYFISIASKDIESTLSVISSDAELSTAIESLKKKYPL